MLATMDGSLRAIIYLLLGHPLSRLWEQQCYDHVAALGYMLDSQVSDRFGDEARPGFVQGLAMLIEGRADVMVVATADYLPEDWIPRLEVAGAAGRIAIPAGNRPIVPRQRRPRPRDAGRGRQL